MPTVVSKLFARQTKQRLYASHFGEHKRHLRECLVIFTYCGTIQ